MRGRRPSQANIVNLDCIAWEAGNDEISWVLTYARPPRVLWRRGAAPRPQPRLRHARMILFFFLLIYPIPKERERERERLDLNRTADVLSARTSRDACDAACHFDISSLKRIGLKNLEYDRHRRFNKIRTSTNILIKLVTTYSANRRYREKLKNASL